MVASTAGGVDGVMGKARSRAAASWVGDASVIIFLGVLGSSTNFLAFMFFLLIFLLCLCFLACVVRST